MDKWLKALIAVACIVIILAGGWFAIDQFNQWSDRRDQQAAIDRRLDILACNNVSLEYANRLSGKAPQRAIPPETLVNEVQKCDRDHPETTSGLGEISLAALTKASTLVEGRSIAVMDQPKR